METEHRSCWMEMYLCCTANGFRTAMGDGDIGCSENRGKEGEDGEDQKKNE